MRFGKGKSSLIVAGLAALLAFGATAPFAYADEPMAAGLSEQQTALAEGDEQAKGDGEQQAAVSEDEAPVAEPERGVVVTDKNAKMEIPLYGGDGMVFNGSVSGVLNGSAVPEGARVYLQWSSVQDYIDGVWIGGDNFELYVNGKLVDKDFGTLTITKPVVQYDQNGEMTPDGKLHDIVIETIEFGWPINVLSKNVVQCAWAKGATVSWDVTDLTNRFFSVTMAGLVHVDSENIEVAGDTGIKASGKLEGANIPAGATVELKATELKKGDPAYDKLVESMNGGLISGVYDISMYVNGNQIHDGFGELAISIPVDAKYNGHWVYFWHLHSNGEVTVERTIVKDGYMTVSVKDLSAVSVEIGDLADEDNPSEPSKPSKPSVDQPSKENSDKAPATSEGKLPQTGDPSVMFGATAVAGAAMASVGARIKKRR